MTRYEEQEIPKCFEVCECMGIRAKHCHWIDRFPYCKHCKFNFDVLKKKEKNNE